MNREERRPSYNISYECHDSFVFEELSRLVDEDDDSIASDISDEEDAKESSDKICLVNIDVVNKDDGSDNKGQEEAPKRTRRGSLGLGLGQQFSLKSLCSLASITEHFSGELAPRETQDAQQADDPLQADAPVEVARKTVVSQFQTKVINQEIRAGNIMRSVSVGAFGRRSSFTSCRTSSWGSRGRSGTCATFAADTIEQSNLFPELSTQKNETFGNSLSRGRNANSTRNRAASSAGRALLRL